MRCITPSSRDAADDVESAVCFPGSSCACVFFFVCLPDWCTNRISKYRPSYKVIQGYELYAIASALGFSTIENIGYLLSGALSEGSNSLLDIFLNTLGRTFISTPLHLMTGYLIGLMVIRRDLLGETNLRLWRVMGFSVFWHGTFDFGLSVVWEWGQRGGKHRDACNAKCAC